MAHIIVQADRRDVLRIDLENETLEVDNRDALGARVLAFEGEVHGQGRRVSGETALGSLIAGELREGMLDGRIRAIRIFAGTGQQMNLLMDQMQEGEIRVLRSGRPISIEDTSLLELLMPDQHRFLVRGAKRR